MFVSGKIRVLLIDVDSVVDEDKQEFGGWPEDIDLVISNMQELAAK